MSGLQGQQLRLLLTTEEERMRAVYERAPGCRRQMTFNQAATDPAIGVALRCGALALARREQGLCKS